MKTKILLIVLFFLNLTGLKAQWVEVNSNTTNIVSKISFADSANGFAAGGYLTMLKTKDAGKTWEAIKTDFIGTSSIFGIDKDTVYASYEGLNKSVNSCQTWNKIMGLSDSPGITDIFFTAPQIGLIIKGGTIYKTKDYGLNWYQVYDHVDGGKIAFPSQDIGYITRGGIIHCQLSPCPFNPFYGYVIKTTDGGETWQQLNFFGDSLQIVAATFLTDNIGYCFTNTNVSSVCKTTDGGETWTNSIVNFYIQDGVFINESVGFILSNNGKIYVTKNGGIDWQLEYTSDKELLYLGASDKVVMTGGRHGALLRRELGDLIQTNRKDLKSNTNGVAFFPNPSTGILYFKPGKEIKSVSIKNLSGQTVYRTDKIENRKLDVGNLTSGIYLVEVESADQKRIIQKMVISK